MLPEQHVSEIMLTMLNVAHLAQKHGPVTQMSLDQMNNVEVSHLIKVQKLIIIYYLFLLF